MTENAYANLAWMEMDINKKPTKKNLSSTENLQKLN
jgi:hypothetical protein